MFRKVLLLLALPLFAEENPPTDKPQEQHNRILPSCADISPETCKAIEDKLNASEFTKKPVAPPKPDRGDYYKALAQVNYNAYLESQAKLAIAVSQANPVQAAQDALAKIQAAMCPGAKFITDAKGEPGCEEPAKPITQ